MAKGSDDETLGATHLRLGLGVDRMQGARPVVQSPGLFRIEPYKRSVVRLDTGHEPLFRTIGLGLTNPEG